MAKPLTFSKMMTGGERSRTYCQTPLKVVPVWPVAFRMHSEWVRRFVLQMLALTQLKPAIKMSHDGGAELPSVASARILPICVTSVKINGPGPWESPSELPLPKLSRIQLCFHA
eukprot:3050016-Alexandrium_andersonii.AAC.1